MAIHTTKCAWCQQNFAAVNSKYNGKIELAAAIAKNVENTIFEICVRDKNKKMRVNTQVKILK